MKIITLPVGLIEANCYIVYNDKDALVIDPGGEADRIAAQINRLGLRVACILLTHGHFDHIGAVQELRKVTGATVCIHEQDAGMLTSAEKNASAVFGRSLICTPAETLLHDQQTLQAGDIEIQVLHTPGHTKGSVCFIIEDGLFSGDTLFSGSVGRSDLPGGSAQTLNESLKKLKALKRDFVVYAGHGPRTTLEAEKKGNPFMRRL